MQCVCSSPPYLQILCHICCIWKVFILHELLLHVNSYYFFFWKNPITIVTLQSLVSKILFWKGILDSWTITIWFLKLPSVVKLLAQKSHCTLLPSWSDAMWLFKSSLFTNPTSHMLHYNGFYPSWTVVICSFKLILSDTSVTSI